jgi:hypothetical protein
MISLCEKLDKEITDFDTIDADSYLDELNKLEKGGAVFMDLTKSDVSRRTMTGAIVAALCFGSFMILIIVATVIGAINDPIPKLALILILSIPTILVILTVTALIQRIKEIRKGEAYEARKY